VRPRIPADDLAPSLLVRTVAQRPRRRQSEWTRWRSFHGTVALAFPTRALRGARVLVIDDVLASGATLSECARVLLDDGGAAAVLPWCSRADRGASRRPYATRMRPRAPPGRKFDNAKGPGIESLNGADRTRRRLVALSLAPGVGAVRIARLLEYFGSVDAAWCAREDALLAVRGLGPAAAAAIIAARGDDGAGRADAMLRRAAECGTRIVTRLDPVYPARLRGIPAPPPVVYLRGAPGRDDRPAVAIVGTRRATPYGVGVAERLAETLAARGVEIVSGLARGIDGAAHRGALRSGGRTVGVLGCGVDVVYPRSTAL
jgi:DNA recombination-mediator protein A